MINNMMPLLSGGNVRFPILGPVLGLAAGFACGMVWQEAREAAPPSSSVAPPLVQPHAGSASATGKMPAPTPSLHVDSAGLVSGHFDRVTPTWLSGALEQAGLVEAPPAGPSMTSVMEPRPVSVDDVDHSVVLSTARHRLLVGTEPERFGALTQAVETGLALPANDLINLFQADQSDRVALLAFAAHVDSVAEDATAAREALARGLESANAAVREDAARRMIEMDSLARVQASTTAQGLQ